MQTSSLSKNRPHLESVLGPLSEEDDASVRGALSEADGVLLEIARHFGHSRAGWEGTGLELSWMPSGQASISSYVSASVNDRCVDFCIEIRPSWYFGKRSSASTWEVVTEIFADCPGDGMDAVYQSSQSARTPVEAAALLHTSVSELLKLAMSFPLEHWLSLASGK